MLHNRRRNRFNGSATRCDNGALCVRVEQAFGNCPQYINERVVEAAPPPQSDACVAAAIAVRGRQLSDDLIALVQRADTMFLGSGWSDASAASGGDNDEPFDAPQHGMDSSHRGGPPGFVAASATRLQFTDRKGNNLFNTIGNLVLDPRVGVLFVDFESGGVLHVTGRATVRFDDSAERDVSIDVDEFVWRPAALPLRWHLARLARPLALVRRVRETDDVASLYFVSAHQGRPLDSFVAGQYLPLRVGEHERTYSLSGPPHAALGHMDDFYRITVKSVGQVSRALHSLAIGSIVLATSRPQGEFVVASGLGAADTLVLIGGGVGVTPLVAMAHSALDNARGPHVEFLVSAPNWAGVVLRDELLAMAESPRLSLSVHLTRDRNHSAAIEPRARVAVQCGRIGAETLRRADEHRATRQRHYYVCGPTTFMMAVAAALRAVGVADDAIHSESFGPSAL
jgi:ferredoxin-NADP reductase